MQSVVGVPWGDGSGTGTGGIIQIIPASSKMAIKAWMGTWKPQVFHFI